MSDPISRRQFHLGGLRTIGLGLVATALPATADVLLAGPAGAATTDVVPIDSALLVSPTDTLSALVATVLRNTNQYAVTTWWNTAKNYAAQGGAAYLDFAGTGENQIRPPAAQSFGLATALRLGVYAAAQTGVSEAAATAMTTRLVGSLAYRHLVNFGSGGWGDAWQSAHWAAFAGGAGWLMWGQLSAKDQEMVRKMVEHEANRFLGGTVYSTGDYYRRVDGSYAYPGDTRAEEIAWNNQCVMLAASMMPNHPSHPQWMKAAVALSCKANSRPADVGTGPSAGKTFNGFGLGTMSGSNVNADLTVVNHGIVHPDYMTSFGINLSGALSLSLANQPTPYVVRRSFNNMYAALVDLDFTAGTMPYTDPQMAGQVILSPGGRIYAGTSTDPNATADIYFPMGNDWGDNHRTAFACMDVFADSFKEDDLASVKGASWATRHLTKNRLQQERSVDRRTFVSSTEFNYDGREEWVSHHIAWAYLARVVSASGLYRITQADY